MYTRMLKKIVKFVEMMSGHCGGTATGHCKN